MNDLSELRNMVTEYDCAVHDTGIELEKAETILQELLDQYHLDFQPDIRKAFEFMTANPGDGIYDRDGKLTWEFVLGHNKIIQFLIITLDYVRSAERCIAKVDGGAAV